MPITTLPALSRTATTFKADVDTFFGTQLPAFATEANALETNVNSKEANAVSSATTATTKAGEASASAAAALTSQNSAGTSAATATTKAGEASTSATSASGSATTATTKAAEAAASAASVVRDGSGGVAGLTLFKLNLRNAANTFTSFLTNAATAARTWTMPDKDGTVAMTSDITGGTSAGSFSTLSATHASAAFGATVKTNDATAANNAGVLVYNVASATAASRRSILFLDPNGGDGVGGDYVALDVLGNGALSLDNAIAGGSTKISFSGSPVANFSPTGLAVTGTLSATGGTNHSLTRTGADGSNLLELLGGSGGASASFYTTASGQSGASASATLFKLGRDNGTLRSINASGTVNASGADYAEYERNNGLTIPKGSIVGFKADGTLTSFYAEAVRFAIKSTNPSYVGGDTWGSEDQVGKRPDEPQRIADKTEQRLFSEAVQAVVGVAAQPAIAASPAEHATVTTEEVVLVNGVETVITRSQLVETKAAVVAQAAIEGVAAVDAQEAVYETIITEAGDTDAQWVTKQAAYETAKAAFEAALEAARQQVDRIAYSGKVPCNVLGATPGGYIIASELDGHIAGQFVADPDFAQYKRAVGRVNRLLPDGRCEVAVIIH